MLQTDIETSMNVEKRILAAHATYGHIRRKLESIITLHKNAHTEKYWKRVKPWFSCESLIKTIIVNIH